MKAEIEHISDSPFSTPKSGLEEQTEESSKEGKARITERAKCEKGDYEDISRMEKNVLEAYACGPVRVISF